LRFLKGKTLSVVLLVAGLAALLLLLPGLFSTAAPPLQVAFGWGAFVVCAALVGGGVAIFIAQELHWHFAGRSSWRVSWKAVALAELLLLLLLTLTHLATDRSLEAALAGKGGGLVGWAGSTLLSEFAGRAGAMALAVVAAVFAAWFLAREVHANGGRELVVWWSEVLHGLLPRRAEPVVQVEETAPSSGKKARSTFDPRAAAAVAGGASRRVTQPVPTPKPTSSASAGEGQLRTRARSATRSKPRPDSLPPLGILRPDLGVSGSSPDVRLRAQTLKQTLAEFGVPVEIVSIKEGPTVTQFGLEPGEVVRELRDGEVQRRRVSVHSILRLNNDLALALAAPSIRIEAPVPGRPYVGVEVPNAAKTLVSLRSVLESNEFARVSSPLAVAVGRDVSGDPVVLDLTALPHLLIAGATGSGKSVCINSIVCSLLMSNDPVTVRLIMVDPKMVELPAYNGIPHLIGPVLTEPTQVPAALAWLTLQMDERYRLFADNGVRNIAGYNRKFAKSRTTEHLPYIILVVDELADLMMSTAFDIERQICRLAQLSRATGIHLVLATQRPSVDVITGLIKANFPARIAFAVTTQIDSRVILDAPGAEKLLGRGDMLYMAPDSAHLARIQGCFVADREVDAIVDFWKTSYEDSDTYRPALAPWAEPSDVVTDRDELLEDALRLVRSKTHISTSLLQRHLRIGFPRAARLMEQLEERGIVGPDEGGGRSRRVLERQAEMVDRMN
jgi:S-DNA-T family DNA segregation ATPase FtsK/SpoIIIE